MKCLVLVLIVVKVQKVGSPILARKIVSKINRRNGTLKDEDLPNHNNYSNNSQESYPGVDSSQSQVSTLVPKEVKQYVNTQVGLYFALYLTFSMGMMGTVLATNLIEFFVFFELMLILSFFLIAFYGYGARRRIALCSYSGHM